MHGLLWQIKSVFASHYNKGWLQIVRGFFKNLLRRRPEPFLSFAKKSLASDFCCCGCICCQITLAERALSWTILAISETGFDRQEEGEKERRELEREKLIPLLTLILNSIFTREHER